MTKRNLRMKCPNCGHWNRVPANKIVIEQTSPIDPTMVKVLIPICEPLEISKCKKRSKIVAEPKELIRVVKESA